MQVTLYLNLTSNRFMGYEDGDYLHRIYSYNILEGYSDTSVCEHAFAVGNGMDDDLSEDYYFSQGPHSSLSVGDVVQLDDRAYACRNVGWTQIEPPHTTEIFVRA